MAAATTPNNLSMKKHLNILLTSRERLTCRSQLMVPYWPEVLKNQSETKADTEFARAFDSINKMFFHGH
jgi:hypothetical protein